MDTRVGYCPCGFEVWIEYLWNGKDYIYRFCDVDRNEISHCPDCGRVLDEDNLE